jgi:hypothetical protein
MFVSVMESVLNTDRLSETDQRSDKNQKRGYHRMKQKRENRNDNFGDEIAMRFSAIELENEPLRWRRCA